MYKRHTVVDRLPRVVPICHEPHNKVKTVGWWMHRLTNAIKQINVL